VSVDSLLYPAFFPANEEFPRLFPLVVLDNLYPPKPEAPKIAVSAIYLVHGMDYASAIN